MSDARKKVKSMFEALAEPPSPAQAVGNLEIPHVSAGRRAKTEPMTQLNLRVPVSVKRKVRVLAARDSVSLSEVILRAVALYEERHGSAPDL